MIFLDLRLHDINIDSRASNQLVLLFLFCKLILISARRNQV